MNFMSLAISFEQLPAQLGHVFYIIVFPMLLLMGVGYAIQRWVGMDLVTLKRLNFYFVMPGIIFYSVVTSELKADSVVAAIGFSLALLLCMSLLTLLVAYLRKIPKQQRNTMVLTTMLFNSGNYALPLQERTFAAIGRSSDAMAMQALVMITQNFFTFTVGIFIAAGGQKRSWKDNLLHIIKLPPIYAILAAVVAVQIRNAMGGVSGPMATALDPWWQVVVKVKEAFIAVALLTLGAQLATVNHGKGRYPVRTSVFLRLLVGPAVGLFVIYAFRLSGFEAQVLLIASASPTAVNCMLLCLEFDNNPDYAATAVFYSTLLSPVTVTLVIFLARSGLLPGFTM